MASSRTRSLPLSGFSFQRWIRGPGFAGAACLVLASACGSNGGQTGDEHTDNGDVVEKLTGTAQRLAASADLPNSASSDGWNFGWKFYAAEADATKNVFLSPYSVSVASSMLVAGAAGDTEAEMRTALSFSNAGDAFHQARNSVAQALDARNRKGTADQNEQTLRVVNDIWLEPTFRPRQTFLDTLSAYYGASAYLAPFSTDPEAARVAINDKVSRDTEGLIQDLLPEKSVDDAAVVLTNALYFKARWSHEFSKPSTVNEPFLPESGASVQVPMMKASALITAQVVDDAYTAIALPYERNELELVAIMPAPGTFAAFVDSLDAATVTRITTEMQTGAIDLSFPKFGIEASVQLKERLQGLGMQRAFDANLADFSALSEVPIYISNAFHKATLRIDEEGTEAAAATGLVGSPASLPSMIIPIVFDHPFVFFIRDVETNALLFIGHYARP